MAEVRCEVLVARNRDARYAKPCEDFVFAEAAAGVFVVCDGATRLKPPDAPYPDPSPAAAAARAFAEAAGAELMASAGMPRPPRERLTRAFEAGSLAVATLNGRLFPVIDYEYKDFATTAALAAILEDDRLHLAWIADCACYIGRGEELRLVTSIQTAVIEAHIRAVGYERRNKLEISRDVRNNPNHPACFGGITGEPAALDFVEYAELDIACARRVLLVSDGVLELLDRRPELGLTLSPAELVAQMEQIERADDIRSDDKSIVALDFA